MMNIQEILEYTRTYLGRGLSLQNSVCLPQENLAQIRQSIGGMILGPCDLKYNPNRDHRVNWIPSDTLERFRKHKKDPVTLKCLEHFGWCNKKGTPTDIRYDLNPDGFRVTDGYDRKGIVFYGCSHTFGMGIPNETTFPQIVSDHFNCANFNFGVPGAGLDISALHALFLLPHIVSKPKAIVCLNPPPRRWNFFMGVDILSKGINSLPKDPTVAQTGEMSYQCVTNDMNNLMQTTKNIIVLQRVAEELDVPFFLVDWAHGFRKEYRAWEHYKWQLDRGIDSFEGISMARDLSHPGVDTHKVWAEDIIELLEGI